MSEVATLDLPVCPDPTDVPIVDLDPFGEEVLADPLRYSHMWRDAGPIFWLSSIKAYGIARHAELLSVLKDWEHFCSGGGVTLRNKLVDPGALPKSMLLEADPPEHRHSRSVVNKVFSAAALQPLFEGWRVKADALVSTLVERGRFDVMPDLATAYGHAIVPPEIGLREHRPDLLHVYGNAFSNSVYPRNERYIETQTHPLLPEAVAWVEASCQRDRLLPGGWGESIHQAADRGECTHAKAAVLTRSLIMAGVENTVITLGNMVHAFATHPDQWELLKSDRDKYIRGAIEEVMRWDGPSIHFFRTTAKDTSFAGAAIPAHSKILMGFQAANRDPRRWADPDRFDITRNPTGQLGFGAGIHQCLGQIVARKQLTLILEALLDQTQSIRLAGQPVRKVSNQSHAFDSLPIEVVPA